MTEIKTINSNSQGNGYLLKSGGQVLVLELGCKFTSYVEHLNLRDFATIVGCAHTHRHSDHLNMSTAHEFTRRGISVYAHEEVIKDAGLSGFLPLVSNKRNKVGQFIIQTFPTPHNVPNYGFLITTPTNERILFVTDTTGVNLRFRDIDCIMVECNHDDDTLLENISDHAAGRSHPEFHLGLNECAEFCKQNISTSTKQVVLIHLSQTNINESLAVETVKEYARFDNVSVAHKGDNFIIENDDF